MESDDPTEATDEPTDEQAHVGVQIPIEQKQRWEAYADENHRTLSHLIRLAVERESGAGGGSEQLEQQVGELTSHIGRLEGTLLDLQDEVGVIRQEVENDPEIQELASDVFAILPAGPDEVQVATYGNSPSEPGNTVTSGHPDDIAETLGESEVVVRQALQYLRQNTAQVHEVQEAGRTHYYKGE